MRVFPSVDRLFRWYYGSHKAKSLHWATEKNEIIFFINFLFLSVVNTRNAFKLNDSEVTIY